MNLAVQAPERVDLPLPDETARTRLLAWLTHTERIALGAGTCASLIPAPLEQARTLSMARQVAVHDVKELAPGRFSRQSIYRATSNSSLTLPPTLVTSFCLVLSPIRM